MHQTPDQPLWAEHKVQHRVHQRLLLTSYKIKGAAQGLTRPLQGLTCPLSPALYSTGSDQGGARHRVHHMAQCRVYQVAYQTALQAVCA